MNIYIFSLGQILQTNYLDSVNAFAEYVRTSDGSYYKIVTDVIFGKYKQDSYVVSKIDQYGAFAFTMGAYILDKFYYKTIASYQKSLISTDEFKSKIASQLMVFDGQSITDAWKIMCKVSDESIQVLKNFAKSGHSFVITSVTNKLQFDYIMQQLSEYSVIEKNVNFYFITSFENNLIDHNSLALKAVELYSLDKNENFIVSCHSSIKNLNLKNAEFGDCVYNNFQQIEDFSLKLYKDFL